MSIAIRSSSTAAYTTASTLVITKPGGLTVGDYIVAHISGGAAPSSVPSGFTAIRLDNSTVYGSFYEKFADSGDVAATDFTFGNTGGGGGQQLGGALIAMTGVHTVSPSSVNAYDNDASSSATFTNTVTPNNANSLLLFAVASFLNSSVTITSSGYAITTDNPSWTELYDQAVAGSNSYQMALAYATRPQVTATGNSSATFSTGSDFIGTMIVIRPQIVSTTTESLTTSDSVVKGLTKVITDSITSSETITTTKSRNWTNTSKNSSTWTYTNKD